jgi:hypothetical protein
MSDIIIRSLAGIIGFILITIALFLYEDEEYKLRNRLVEWSAVLGNKKLSFTERHSTFLKKIFFLTDKILTEILGTRYFSLRLVFTSIIFSALGFIILILITNISNQDANRSEIFFYFGIFAILFFIPLILKKTIYQFFSLFFALISAVLIFPLKQKDDGIFMIMLFILLTIGVINDIITIPLLRYVVRKGSQNLSFSSIIILIAITVLSISIPAYYSFSAVAGLAASAF